MKKIAVISYFPNNLDKYKQKLASFDFIIAADAGMNALTEIGMNADLCIGDFDSINKELLDVANQSIQLPVMKDETDTHAALSYGYSIGNDVTLFASLSGRSDHSFGLLGLYYSFIRKGKHLKMLTEQGKIEMLLPGTHYFTNEGEKYISCFAYGEDVYGLTLEGVQYPLSQAILKIGSDLGCSNVFTESEMKVTFSTGTLLVYFIEKEVE
ncbi:MAG: thiamine diphosphokinase [Culicoidibacterales bacterium]